MNFKTTLFLLVLVAAGGVFSWLGPALSPWLLPASVQPQTVDAGTLRTLEQELTADKLSRIDVRHGDRHVLLERTAPAGDWTLPGKWPTRKAEVEELVRLVTGLRSRFMPVALGEPPDLKNYGLEQPPVIVTVRTGEKEHRLAFGEEADESNRFSRPTYLRLDENPEVLRLAPGLVAALDRPQDYYQQRRLFPAERMAKEGDPQEKVERLVAKAVAVKGPGGGYRLEREGEAWVLQDPVQDLPDPEKLKTLLAAVPDIWAEQFVHGPKPDLAEYGLKSPEQTLRVTRPDGDTTLLIGKQSQTKTRAVLRPAPNFGGPPMPPQREVVHEEYRFAKLQDNDQIFEIKADKLKDVFVAADTLRDATLARFRGDDARRLEINQAGQEIALVKEDGKWRIQKPLHADAEGSKVTELLDRLSGLQARDKDVIDKADAKAYGLDKPAATVRVTVEEPSTGEGASKAKKTKSFTFTLGKHDAEKAKLYVRVAGRERINAVEDSLLKLVQRPALAYRGRRILDFSSTDLARIEVRRGSEPYALEQVKGAWHLTAPVQADVDSSKAGQLAGDLGRLEAVEYVSESAAADALESLYGLGKPGVSAKVTFTDATKPAQTLLIGKQRPGKPEYFAKLDSAPGVFVVKKEIHDALDQDSLAYRPLQLWQLQAEDIKELRVRKEEPEYQLKRDGQTWKITGPFEATALADLARPMADELANLRCERYAAHAANDLTAYGLDKPYLRLTLPAAKKEGPKEEAKDRILLIGKPTGKAAKTRFAKLEDNPAVFVVGEKTVSAVDHGALDLLDRNLLALEAKSIERIRSQGTSGSLTLQRKGDEWQVTECPAAPFPADSDTMAAVLGVWSNLRALRFVAYGTHVNPAAYGLDKPATTITVTQKAPADNGKAAKPVEHTLILGKAPGGAPGERFARLDDRPGVVVLAANVVSELTHGYLDFVNRTVLQFDAAKVASLQRRMGGESLEIVKRDNGWQVLTPADLPADAQSLEGLVGQLATLRAKRVAAYPAKELQPFGLDNPVATVTVRLAGANGKPEEHVLKIGKAAEGTKANGDRFAVAGNGTAVFVLPEALARRLTAPLLQFRDHNLARFTDADRVTLERERRKAVFAKVDGTWKLTEPLEAEAEQTDLEDFVNAVARLRAEELVADKPANLKAFGLDRPAVRWRFQAGDKEVLNLLIGGPEKLQEQGQEKEGPRRYAKLAAGDFVFLLSPALTAKVLGEYRTRTLWAPLDAAQIDRLSYGYAHNPFVLEKLDTDWHVAGKPGVKVKPEVIREALDALAGLKAARYVVDKDADLKLYGLEPPQLVLEVQTRTGKRVLHIGRPEGESNRYYARVPEGGNSAVFVTAEADAGRIVKLLAAFTQEASKAVLPTP